MTLSLLSVVLSESGNPGRLVRLLRKMAQLFWKVAPFISCRLSSTAALEKGTLFYREFLFFKGEKKKYMVFTGKKTGPFGFILVATSEMEVGKARNTHEQLRLDGMIHSGCAACDGKFSWLSKISHEASHHLLWQGWCLPSCDSLTVCDCMIDCLSPPLSSWPRTPPCAWEAQVKAVNMPSWDTLSLRKSTGPSWTIAK